MWYCMHCRSGNHPGELRMQSRGEVANREHSIQNKEPREQMGGQHTRHGASPPLSLLTSSPLPLLPSHHHQATQADHHQEFGLCMSHVSESSSSSRCRQHELPPLRICLQPAGCQKLVLHLPNGLTLLRSFLHFILPPLINYRCHLVCAVLRHQSRPAARKFGPACSYKASYTRGEEKAYAGQR